MTIMSSPNFFAELKRRNVYKVAIAYAVVAWLLIQVATQIFPFFEIPNWAVRLIVLAIVLGFPIALIIAWAFELTPDGIKRTTESDEPAPPRREKPVWIFVVLGAGALSLALFFVGRYTAGPGNATASVDKSIAVLPFANLSRDPDNAYFADGIQDEILTRLAKIGDLKVISRTSTQRYKSTPENLPEIAKQLGVAHILEGSVQKSGDSVRVNVQLIRAEGDAHIWADTFDRKLTDIFAVESEVAQRIAASLEAKLTGREKEAVSSVSTKVPAAYDAYLRAIVFRNSQSPEDQQRLIDLCRQAVALDPSFAAAWADIAVAEGLKYLQGERDEAQRARTEEAAKNALRLDPDHGSGHAAMGMYLYYCLKEYDQALAELQQAREQAPNDPLPLQAIGLVKRRQGKLDESIELQLQASQRDPLNQDIWVNLGWTYRGMRKFAEAHSMFDRALAIAPKDESIIDRRAEVYFAEGDLATTVSLVRHHNPPVTDRGYFGRIGVLEFQRKFDEAIAKITEDLAAAPSLPPVLVAALHISLGRMHVGAGRRDQAQPFLVQAEAELNAINSSGGPNLLGLRIELNAYLGRRGEVEREAAEHIAADAKDRWQGPQAEIDVARAFAVLGDGDRVFPMLERLLVHPYSDSLTPAYLRFDPAWDPIRDDPRFQALANPP
ncbi:MAG: tetratricopeptide repeat protein [Chthoniobacterales bacterium]